ncbi:Txe/YoeB family addiction module toxin [Deinococcus sp.]|uniref:Txe/YoeB family addiction module toxin n=1 Tax=Deinococcus sp. TaxID=47478 RepID=UPI0025DEAFBF|nr:Txe/YoeB family addiction module toxin [Deinococcus sp.]
MKVSFQDDGWEDYLWWQENDLKGLRKLNRLIEECRRTPFEGTGKPEPLRHDLAGLWSRRITEKHRLVYAIVDDALVIAGCRFHHTR